MNIEKSRSNMISRQIRPWMVTDDKILDLLKQIPREDFVGEEYASQALTDTNLPLLSGRQMMTPKEEARLVQALQIKPSDKVLEVGTGSGYITALLANLAQSVTTVDIEESFLTRTEEKLNHLSINNVKYSQISCFNDIKIKEQYDVIVVTGSTSSLNKDLVKSLKQNGRLACIVGSNHLMCAYLLVKISEDQIEQTELYETSLAPLSNSPQKQLFHF